MSSKLSSGKLLIAWCLLVALTVVTIVGGRADTGSMQSLGPVLFALLMSVTAFKAQQILTVYLGLRNSTLGWRAGFSVMVWGLCALLWGLYVLDQWI